MPHRNDTAEAKMTRLVVWIVCVVVVLGVASAYFLFLGIKG